MPEKQVTSESQSPPGRGMRPAFILLVAVYLLGTALQHVLLRVGLLTAGSLKAWAILIGCVAFLLAVLSGLRPAWRKFLASNRFSVPVLIWLTVLSIVGVRTHVKRFGGPPALTIARLKICNP